MWSRVVQKQFMYVLVGAPYNRAIQAVRSIRDRLSNSESSPELIAAEQRSNFAPYIKSKGSAATGKGKSWTLKVVCLSDKNSKRVPCGGAEREALVQAGLGEKKIVVTNIDCSSQEFKDILTAGFPKLNGCGGFDILRCIPNTKELEVINTTISQSPKLLKSVIGGGRIFIRPIQKNLSMQVDMDMNSAEVIIIFVIELHIHVCAILAFTS